MSERFDGTENNATDTAKTVDTYFDSHIFHQLFVSDE